MPAHAPSSTYRLQVRPGFDLAAVAELCDYLADLGVGALYLSPLLPSASGSDHGYDVVAHDGIDAERGGSDAWARALAVAREHGLAVVVDIVPNHMGVARAEENAAWWDMLRLGSASAYADWFDVDWSSGRVRLPVLGDDFDSSQLSVVDDELHYFDHRFPIAPGTDGGAPADVHARQHYELVNHRRADTEQNYRRFFAVTTLAGVRVEALAVFDATHAQIARWLRGDRIGGLRVDHPDGLADPRGYLARLREIAGPETWIIVEKILEPDEWLPDWPVDGTTGYDALAEVAGVFVDPSGISELDALYREMVGHHESFAAHAAEGKREVATGILTAEVARLAALATDVPRAQDTLVELLVRFPVYRSYAPERTAPLDAAANATRAARPDLAAALDALVSRLRDHTDELCVRFQQTSGAVMAKGVEDCAYYRYTRFVAANEVGGDPANPARSPAAFHAAQQLCQAEWPASMTTLSTHDTKRGEDVRARLAVLAELSDEWGTLARQLTSAVPLPEPRIAYLLWQTLAGTGFIARERMHSYAEKAMRESGLATGWTDPAAAFESRVHALVDRAYDDPVVHDPLAAFVERITPHDWSNSLSQKLIQLTMPGVPDVYQGTELWEDSLVDPDNRRPVDFAARRALLAALDADSAPPTVDASGRAKLWITSRALRLRRDRPELFSGYTPVDALGPAAPHVVAFDRGGAITVTTRLPVGLERDGGWRDTVLALDGAAADVLTDRRFDGEIRLADLLSSYPVALLARVIR